MAKPMLYEYLTSLGEERIKHDEEAPVVLDDFLFKSTWKPKTAQYYVIMAEE